MFRKMRRAGQQLSAEESAEILKNGTNGILAVMGDEGYPYTVPLNYVLLDGCVYFHCACDGHKTDAVKQGNKASFCVVEKDTVVPQIRSTNYRSIVAFGRIRLVTEDDRKRKALLALAEKYCPDFLEDSMEEIKTKWNRPAVLELRIEHLTGKEASKKVIEFAKENQ